MMPLIRAVSTDTRSGRMSSLISMRGSSSWAAVSVTPLAIRSARISTVLPSVPSISTLPLVLPMWTWPPAASGYVCVQSSVARPARLPRWTSHAESTRASGAAARTRSRRESIEGLLIGTYGRAASSVQLDRDQLGHARLLHCHPIEAVGDLHCFPIVCDDDELGVLLHAAQHLDEPADVGIVERSVDFVEQAERARLEAEHAEHQGDRRERLLATRQQLHALQALPGRLGDDLDAALERIVLVEQREPGAPAPEQRAERLLEVPVDGRERLAEALAGRLVDPLDRLSRLRDRFGQVLALSGQEGMPRLELVELLDGHHVDRAEAFDLGAQGGDGFLGRQRTLLRRDNRRVGTGQVRLACPT